MGNSTMSLNIMQYRSTHKNNKCVFTRGVNSYHIVFLRVIWSGSAKTKTFGQSGLAANGDITSSELSLGLLTGRRGL